MTVPITNIETISAQDAALMLRQKLGNIRAWSDFLSDCIRAITSLHGRTLLPVARQHDGKAFRPRYARSDVLKFIRDVLADGHGRKEAITIISLPIDTAKGWRVQKFDTTAKPVARLTQPTWGLYQ